MSEAILGALRAATSPDSFIDWMQFIVVAVLLWYLVRSEAIKALRQSVEAVARRVEELEAELEKYGCRDLECDTRQGFSREKPRERLKVM